MATKTARVKGVIKPDDVTTIVSSLEFEYEEDEEATFTVQMEYTPEASGGPGMRPTSVSKNL